MPPIRLTEAEFCTFVVETLDSLPEQFLAWLENVAVDVAPYPDARLRRHLGLARNDASLMGLFEGNPVTEQGFGEHLPNRIWLFQRAIEAHCQSIEQVRYEIRRTVLHELAHHFGYDEEDLEEFEAQSSPFDDDGPDDRLG